MGDLSSEVFRTHGHQIIDWIVSYLTHPERYPVLPRVAPGEISAALPTTPPEHPEPLDRILADFQRVLLPGVTHWNHPGFYAYFPKSVSGPGILGELLTAALDVNAMLWKSSPAATELETVVLDWLRQLLGLQPGWFGVINDTASMSTLLALAAAREAAGLDIRRRGTAGRPDLPALRIYCSEQAHSSIDKAALALGFGQENVVHIGTDDEFGMRTDLLQRAIHDDQARGMRPVAVVGTIGTTAMTSIDPVPAIAEICRQEGVWLHIDAAYGGAVGVVPEMRPYLAGVDAADSLVVNPHKWLLTPSDCSVLWVKDQALLKRTFSLVPEYLVTAEQDEAINLMDYGVQLGRRFRALKLWMVLRAFGAEGLAARVRAHCALAAELAQWVDAEPGWERMAPTRFSLVCFRYAPPGMDTGAANRVNETILARVNASGEAFLSHARLSGKYTLRLAIGNLRTERRHVARAWDLLRAAVPSSA